MIHMKFQDFIFSLKKKKCFNMSAAVVIGALRELLGHHNFLPKLVLNFEQVHFSNADMSKYC